MHTCPACRACVHACTRVMHASSCKVMHPRPAHTHPPIAQINADARACSCVSSPHSPSTTPHLQLRQRATQPLHHIPPGDEVAGEVKLGERRQRRRQAGGVAQVRDRSPYLPTGVQTRTQGGRGLGSRLFWREGGRCCKVRHSRPPGEGNGRCHQPELSPDGRGRHCHRVRETGTAGDVGGEGHRRAGGVVERVGGAGVLLRGQVRGVGLGVAATCRTRLARRQLEGTGRGRLKREVEEGGCGGRLQAKVWREGGRRHALACPTAGAGLGSGFGDRKQQGRARKRREARVLAAPARTTLSDGRCWTGLWIWRSKTAEETQEEARGKGARGTSTHHPI
eukprot:365399-Chlamydomonas_euryale.AAC.17